MGLHIGPAAAHAPYYSQTEKLSGQNNQTETMKLLHGDGIFFADPIRAVIVDADGRLLAASPISTTLFIVCERDVISRECIAYDALRGLIYKPDRTNWKATLPLEVSGKPQEYPEYRMDEYGFDKREASLAEVMKYEALAVIASPYSTVVAIIWWLAIWLLLTPLYWGLKRSNWRIKNISTGSFFLTAIRLICALTLVLIAAYGELLSPSSHYYLIFVMLVGAAIALMLTRPKAAA